MPAKKPPNQQTPAERYNEVRQKVMDMAADPEEAFRLARAMTTLNPEVKALVDRAADIHFDRSVADVNSKYGQP